VRGMRSELPDRRHPGYPGCGLCRLYYPGMDQGGKIGGLWKDRLLLDGFLDDCPNYLKYSQPAS